MSEAEKIARRLSEAQRRALLWLPADGSPREHGRGDPREASFYALQNRITGDPGRKVATIYSLCRIGAGQKRPGRIWPPNTWRATPLGLAVRAELLKERDDG